MICTVDLGLPKGREVVTCSGCLIKARPKRCKQWRNGSDMEPGPGLKDILQDTHLPQA